MASLVNVNCTALQNLAASRVSQRPAFSDNVGFNSASCSLSHGCRIGGSSGLASASRSIKQRLRGFHFARRIAAAAAAEQDSTIGEDASAGPVRTLASTDSEIIVGTPEGLSGSAIPALDVGSGVEDAADKAIRTSSITPGLAAIYRRCRTWEWRGHNINYTVVGQGPPVLLVHGFGASIGHFRRNIPVLSEKYTVFAIDLLGLGASAKPDDFVYTMEAWGELLVDFLNEVIMEPTVLLGNSIGSLACLITAAEAAEGQVKGTVLVNCAGGMNNKAIVDDWRLRLALPIFWLINFLLLRPSIAQSLFTRFRSPENVRNVLQSVYSNKDAVDNELLEVILKPADDPGALHCFVSVITGPPGPRPEMLIPRISRPILVLWGDEDPFTPMDGPVGRYFRSLPETSHLVEFKILENCGHCPHDDRPEIVNGELLPWLERVYSEA